jgi:flagellar hook-associated protein 3 FlgL
MRIASTTFFTQSLAAMQKQQADLAYTSRQIGANKRILEPSDDPIGATQALQISQSLALQRTYQSNQTKADNALKLQETVLSDISDIIATVRNIAAEATPTLDTSVNSQYADQVLGAYRSLLADANGLDQDGFRMFAGFDGNTQPFAQASGPSVYAGDTGQRSVEIGPGRRIVVNNPGEGAGGVGVFLNTAADAGADFDVFGVLDAFATALNSGAITQTDIDNAIAGLNTIAANLEQVQTSVSTRRVEINQAIETTTALINQHEDALGRIEQLDQAEAIVRLQVQQTALEAAQQSYVQVAGLSLFNFL